MKRGWAKRSAKSGRSIRVHAQQPSRAPSALHPGSTFAAIVHETFILHNLRTRESSILYCTIQPHLAELISKQRAVTRDAVVHVEEIQQRFKVVLGMILFSRRSQVSEKETKRKSILDQTVRRCARFR